MNAENVYQEMHEIGLKVLEDWKANQGDYDDAFRDLGTKGQFSDIWRKIKKLQKAIWEGKRLVGEQPPQIIAETIHHLIMMLYLLKEETQPKPVGFAVNDAEIGEVVTLIRFPEGSSKDFMRGAKFAVEEMGKSGFTMAEKYGLASEQRS